MRKLVIFSAMAFLAVAYTNTSVVMAHHGGRYCALCRAPESAAVRLQLEYDNLVSIKDTFMSDTLPEANESYDLNTC